MTVSILIVNWNSKDYLRRCLETVRSSCVELSPQVIVVDAGSFDGCGEMITAEFPKVEFIQCPENVGFGRANNMGCERVHHEALLLLNPDTELRPDALSQMLKELKRLPQAGILGPRILNSDGSLQTSCVRSLPTPLNQALDSEWLRRLFPASKLWGTWPAFQSKTPVKVEALSGACMLLKAETFRKVGGFSREFFMYGEDLDLCFKIRQMGLSRHYVPAAEVVHHGGKSSGQQFKKFSTVLMRVSDHRLMKKWLGRSAAIQYRILMGISAMIRLIILAPARLVGCKNRRNQRIQSQLKWWAILRWTLGRETWADQVGSQRSISAQNTEIEMAGHPSTLPGFRFPDINSNPPNTAPDVQQ